MYFAGDPRRCDRTTCIPCCLQISKKRYIYTIDDDCFVATDPTGQKIDALQQHIRNLLTPSTPFFFNTLYDPFAQGTDWVRGVPFSMREGRPTAVSHGARPFLQAQICLLLPLSGLCCRAAALVVVVVLHCATKHAAQAGNMLQPQVACKKLYCTAADLGLCLPVIACFGPQRQNWYNCSGLWLNIPDYDAPTQLVKPAERNTRYVNAVLTIPKVTC